MGRLPRLHVRGAAFSAGGGARDVELSPLLADIDAVIKVAPTTWLSISRDAPTEQACGGSPQQVLALEPRLLNRLREVIAEIAHAQRQRGAGSAATPSKLTDRQREIADLARRGASNKVIARKLGLSVGTVKVHMHRIFRVLDVTSRVQLATRSLAGEPIGVGSVSERYSTGVSTLP